MIIPTDENIKKMITVKKLLAVKLKNKFTIIYFFQCLLLNTSPQFRHQVTACKGVGGFKVDLFNPQTLKLNILLKIFGILLIKVKTMYFKKNYLRINLFVIQIFF